MSVGQNRAGAAARESIALLGLGEGGTGARLLSRVTNGINVMQSAENRGRGNATSASHLRLPMGSRIDNLAS